LNQQLGIMRSAFTLERYNICGGVISMPYNS